MRRTATLVVVFVLVAAACTSQSASQAPGESGSSSEARTPITISLAPFQDSYALMVGVNKGFFDEAGLDLTINKANWDVGNELLIAGRVNMASGEDTDAILQNVQGHDTTLAFPFFNFAAAAVMIDPNRASTAGLTTYDEFFAESGDVDQALKLAMTQLKGKKIGTTTTIQATLARLATKAGMDVQKDFEVIVFPGTDELPPAFLSGSLDAIIGTVPNRLAVAKEGAIALVDQRVLPETVSHSGFVASRAWVNSNLEAAKSFEMAMFKTLKYIEDNPDESFQIISDELKKDGADVPADRLPLIWNKVEFFLTSSEQFEKDIVDPSGRFYWKQRFEAAIEDMKALGTIQDAPAIPLEDLYYGLKLATS